MRRAAQMMLLSGILPVLAPASAAAASSVTLFWDSPSNVADIAGYELYYGNTSGNYTGSVFVSSVATATISNLVEGAVYYFAARTRSASGVESDFSAETAFTNCALALNTVVLPGGSCRFVVPAPESAGKRFTFSLEPGAPVGATINSTNGNFSWKPAIEQASTTNWITVRITDNGQPAQSTFTTLLLVVQDYLAVSLGSVPVQVGQNAGIPIYLTASEGVTNVVFAIDWPSERFINPALSDLLPGIAANLIQSQSNLLVTLQIDPSQVSPGINQLGQLGFQTALNQPSGFVPLPVRLLQATKPNALAYANATVQGGEVAVVGDRPFLRALSAGSGTAQTLSVANPERTLTLFGRVGAKYQLECATSVGGGVTWSPLLTYTQTAVAQTISVPASSSPAFYRLVQ